jgi:hypothetical protein
LWKLHPIVEAVALIGVVEMSQLSQEFIFATLMLAVGLLISILGVYSTLRQKLYYNPTDNSVATEIDIPILGKLKTNVPALVLCFIGLVPIVLAYNEMQGREQALVKFRGKVAIDPSIVAGIKSITVGATSGQWTQSATPNAANPTVDVSIPVPDSWKTYTFYAFAYGGSQTRIAVVGGSDDRTFDLSIAP